MIWDGKKRMPIVRYCEGCSHAEPLSGVGRLCGLFDDRYCNVYLYPEGKWSLGCPLFLTAEKKKELSFEEKRAQRARTFAGKGTSLKAINGALGYKGLGWTGHAIGKNKGQSKKRYVTGTGVA